MTDDTCAFLRDKVKDEVEAAESYRDWAEKRSPSPLLSQLLNEIADIQEEHARSLAFAEEELCPGGAPDPITYGELREKAKAKLQEIWGRAKQRAKYEARLTQQCRLAAMRESKRVYNKTMDTCIVEKKLAPPP